VFPEKFRLPSPKFQTKLDPLAEVFEKETIRGIHPLLGVTVKDGVGFGTTTICFVFIEEHPLTVFFAVKLNV
jgi:hypothetical protein